MAVVKAGSSLIKSAIKGITAVSDFVSNRYPGGGLGLAEDVGRIIRNPWDIITDTLLRLKIMGVAVCASSSELEIEDEKKPPKRVPKYPGNDGTVAPGKDWELRGSGDVESGKGSWYNPEIDESLYPDLEHQLHGPHWGWTDSNDDQWRLYPNGDIEFKY